MRISYAHEKLAEKFMHRQYWEGVLVPDSMRAIVAHAYSEEEAEIVNALGFATVTVSRLASRVNRDPEEVKPLLESLADRLLITSLKIKGIQTYGFLNFVPGLFEAQMIRAKTDQDENRREYYRRFAELYEQFYEEILTWLKSNMAGKHPRLGRIIPVGKSIEHTGGIMPLSTDSFAEVVDRNNSFCLVEVCACRNERQLLGKGCDKPTDVCSAMGWLADFCIEKGLAHRVSKEEYIEAKQRAAAAGLVNMTDNLVNPLQVCSCCSCCCSALRILGEYNIPSIIAASRFEAEVDSELCNGCGKCAKNCPMEAIESVPKLTAKINYSRCIGCGVCVNTCDKQQAMSLRERADYKPPSKTLLDYYADRYVEIRGDNLSLGPRFKLGISRMIGKLSPFSVSGPGYKPPGS